MVGEWGWRWGFRVLVLAETAPAGCLSLELSERCDVLEACRSLEPASQFLRCLSTSLVAE